MIATIAGLGVALAGLSCTGSGSQNPSAEEAMGLFASLEGFRPIEPRLTALTNYAPCTAPASTGDTQVPAECSPPPRRGSPDGDALDRIRSTVRGGGSLPASAELDHVAGLWFLVQRTEGSSDRAVSRLEAAASARPADTGLLNDLGAAYLTRAFDERRPQDLVQGLDAFERAHAIDPDRPEPRFNRALALERLHLCGPAAEAWRSYADDDPASPWGAEAAERGDRLRCEDRDLAVLDRWAAGVTGAGTSETAGWQAVSALVTAAPGEVVRWAWSDLLPAWAEADLAGDRKAAEQLRDRLRRLAEAVEGRADDRTLAASQLAAGDAGSAADRRRLALALRHLGRAARLVRSSRYADAERQYRLAAELARPASPEALWARSGVVLCQVTAARYPEARREIERTRRAADLTAYPSVAARLSWSEGLIQVRTGAFADSRRSFDRVAETYRAMGDSDLASAARALSAESRQALGLAEEAWQVRIEALADLGRRPSGSLHNLLLDAALAADDQGLPHAALALRDADLGVARALGSASRTVEALLWRSKALAAVGDRRAALADLDQALDGAAAIADAAVRGRLTADALEARGALLVERDPPAAVAALSQAIPVYEAADYAWKLPSTLFTRARALQRLGRPGDAERDLRRALAEFERRDRSLPPETFRYSHFERAQEIFDEMVRLQVDAGRTDLALAYADRARRAAWPLEARPGENGVDGPDGERLQRLVEQVPAGTAVVELAVVGDRLLTWVVRDGSLRFYHRPAEGLESRIEGFWRLLASSVSSPEETQEAAEALYRDLVGPWIGSIPPGERLVLVPDRYLHRLAFAALRDPGSGRWLAETRVVSTAPSLAFAVGAGRSPADAAGRRGVLLVGDPRFDPAETGHLPPLPGAAEEVRRLAARYPGATALTGDDATKSAFLAALGDAELLHYAGHALASPRRPWASSLPLAPPAGGGSGLLLASEVHALGTRVPRVVVLSACGTGSGGTLRAAGFSALVSAFLARGTEAVVASLWSVDDRTVQPLAVELHRGLAAGLSPAEALNQAQRRLLAAHPDLPPHSWASFRVTGVASARGGAETTAGAR